MERGGKLEAVEKPKYMLLILCPVWSSMIAFSCYRAAAMFWCYKQIDLRVCIWI